MHILQVHNTYKDIGGEDIVVAREKAMLEEQGHIVSQYIVSNNDVQSFFQKIKTALALPYSLPQKNALKRHMQKHLPAVVHVHNFLPIITPAVFYACRELNIPVVLTLHNYRLLCSNGILYRSGGACEDCLSNKWGLAAVQHGCYQDSKMASVFPVVTNAIHNYLKTWSSHIDKVIVLSEFSQQVFYKSHLEFAAQQLIIKPNFTEDRGYCFEKDSYVLFVGRLSQEKGVMNVIEACIKTQTTLIIAGTGPLENEIKAVSNSHENIKLLGAQNQEQLAGLYNMARAVVTASKMYESFGLVIIEAFSHGTPVIGPSFGNAGILVSHNYNGLHYELNNVDDLANTLLKIENEDEKALRMNARKTFKNTYTKDQNLKQLEAIYKAAIAEKTENKAP